jgi:hypothetical protein
MKLDAYRFSGDWSFDLLLPQMAKLHYGIGGKYHERMITFFTNLEQGYMPVTIQDERNYEPDPTQAQEATIQYIIVKEQEVVEALFKAFQEVINPYYVEACGEDYWIPEMRQASDLKKLIGFSSIIILAEYKEGMAYYEVRCEYKGDEEHGLSVVMYKDQLIGYSGMGDMSYQCIADDLGMDKGKAWEDILAQQEEGKHMVHVPLSKYGKFKPWQQEATEEYFRTLLRKQENEKLIEILKESNWDVNYRFVELDKNLVDLAAYANNVEMTQYLIDKGGDFSRSMRECTDFYIKKEVIALLVQNGANVDILNNWGVTPLHNELHHYARAVQNKSKHEGIDPKRFEQELEKENEHRERVLFYLKMGANPYFCDKEGHNYEEVLLKRWNATFLQESGLLEKVEALVSPNKKQDTRSKEIKSQQANISAIRKWMFGKKKKD